MSEEIDFIDLMALKKIQPDTKVEKFGSLINSSFFDASNILGTLKIKDLVDFTNVILGQNSITITDLGKGVIEDANNKASEPIDQLDHTLLVQLSSGKRSLVDISGAVNIRPKDLAMHLYKLENQEYITSSFRNGNLDLLLTEKGFAQSKAEAPQPPEPQIQQNRIPDSSTQQIPESQAEEATTFNQSGRMISNNEDLQKNQAQPIINTEQIGTSTLQPQPTMLDQQTDAQQKVADMTNDLSGIKPKKGKMQYVFGFVILILIILIILVYTGTI